MKIAIQYFGETRFFDIFSQLLDEYRQDGINNDYSVDFHITTWDNDYTRNLDLSIFDSYHLIESPHDGIKSLLPKKQSKENREGASRGFFNASYSMFVGAYNRFEYQKKNDIHYDLILLVRPDFMLTTYDFSKMVKRFRNQKNNGYLSDFQIIYQRCIKTLESKWSSFNGQDAFWVGTQEAIDLFCKNFHLCFLNDDGGFIPTYHNLPKHTIDRYRLFHDTTESISPGSLHKIWPNRFNYVKENGRLTLIQKPKKRK